MGLWGLTFLGAGMGDEWKCSRVEELRIGPRNGNGDSTGGLRMARVLDRSCEVCVLEMYTWEDLTSLAMLPALNLGLLRTRAKTLLACPLLSTPLSQHSSTSWPLHGPTGLPHSTPHIFSHQMGQDTELCMPGGLVGKIQKYRAPRLR